MLEVQVDNILPVTEARDKLNQLIDSVESSDNMYVMTKNGKPCAILVGVHHLEKLTGEKHEDLFGNNNKSNETEESMSDDPMNPTPPADDTAAPAGSAPQTTPPADDADDTAAPATGGMPPVSDTQSSMAGDIIPEKDETPAPASPFAPAEPTIMTPAAPADTDVAPAAPATPSANPAIGEEEVPAQPADANGQGSTPTPPPAAPQV